MDTLLTEIMMLGTAGQDLKSTKTQLFQLGYHGKQTVPDQEYAALASTASSAVPANAEDNGIA